MVRFYIGALNTNAVGEIVDEAQGRRAARTLACLGALLRHVKFRAGGGVEDAALVDGAHELALRWFASPLAAVRVYALSCLGDLLVGHPRLLALAASHAPIATALRGGEQHMARVALDVLRSVIRAEEEKVAARQRTATAAATTAQPLDSEADFSGVTVRQHLDAVLASCDSPSDSIRFNALSLLDLSTRYGIANPVLCAPRAVAHTCDRVPAIRGLAASFCAFLLEKHRSIVLSRVPDGLRLGVALWQGQRDGGVPQGLLGELYTSLGKSHSAHVVLDTLLGVYEMRNASPDVLLFASACLAGLPYGTTADVTYVLASLTRAVGTSGHGAESELHEALRKAARAPTFTTAPDDTELAATLGPARLKAHAVAMALRLKTYLKGQFRVTEAAIAASGQSAAKETSRPERADPALPFDAGPLRSTAALATGDFSPLLHLIEDLAEVHGDIPASGPSLWMMARNTLLVLLEAAEASDKGLAAALSVSAAVRKKDKSSKPAKTGKRRRRSTTWDENSSSMSGEDEPGAPVSDTVRRSSRRRGAAVSYAGMDE